MPLLTYIYRTLKLNITALFQDVGLGNEAIPLTIALGSPLSGLVLYLYTKSIKKFGSKFTLRVSFAACIFLMTLITLYGRSLRGLPGKVAIVSFYAFREIYVSLLSSQQWAFIAGTLNKSTASYIVTFSGIVSIASAVGGCSIEYLVSCGGVQALLLTALISTVGSCLCAEAAYGWSDVLPVPGHTSAPPEHKEARTSAASTEGASTSIHGKDDSVRRRNKVSSSEQSPRTHKKQLEAEKTDLHTAPAAAPVKKKGGFWSDSWNLICNHHLLQVLFVEGILHQMCGNMLNLMFHNGLRMEIADDATRAILVGRFFATVNITSCTLQCFVLPHVLSHSTLPDMLRRIPAFVLAAVSLGVVQPGLISVMLGFGTIKVIEYSIMHSASEMIYMPMGHEVRYLGKELIRFFGHKLGKSGSSLVLSALVSHLNPSLSVQSIWGALLTLTWGGAMFFLANSIVDRDREQEEQDAKHAARNGSFHPSAAPKTRRKARSFSYDQYSSRKSSNSQAVSRTDVAAAKISILRPPAKEIRSPAQSKSRTVSNNESGREQARPSRNVTHSLDGPSASLQSLRNFALTATPVEMETIPEHAGAASVTATPIAVPVVATTSTAVGAGGLSSLKPVDEPEFVDTVTDASGSPEVSVHELSTRSLDSLQSLGNDYERGDSFSEGPAAYSEYGMDYDDGEEDGERNSFGSSNSTASSERRASWERAQRQQIQHSTQQPVMLRVGSVSVSLSTFNEKAERRKQEAHKT